MPFFTKGNEGFDLNTPYDLKVMNQMIINNEAEITKINKKPWYEI